MASALDTTLKAAGVPARIAKALTAAEIKTLGDVARRTRGQIAELPGIDGHDVAQLETILSDRRLGYIGGVGCYSQCKTCPKCENCGMPRATAAAAVNVVVDYRGIAKHVGAEGDPCHECDVHHRALVAAAAAEGAQR